MSRYRLTVLGDSFSAGWGDPAPHGGFRGWVSRFASLTNMHPDTVHNLACYGATTRETVRYQLPLAVGGEAPLVVAFVGTNDLLADHESFDAAAFRADLRTLFRALSGTGGTVVTAKYPDIPAHLDIPELTRRAFRKRFTAANEALAEITFATGVACIDLTCRPVWRDSTLWDADRLHPGPRLHQHFAEELHALTRLTRPAGLLAAVA